MDIHGKHLILYTRVQYVFLNISEHVVHIEHQCLKCKNTSVKVNKEKYREMRARVKCSKRKIYTRPFYLKMFLSLEIKMNPSETKTNQRSKIGSREGTLSIT